MSDAGADLDLSDEEWDAALSVMWQSAPVRRRARPAVLAPTPPPLLVAPAPEPDEPLEQLEARITAMAGSLAAGTCAWLELIARFHARRGWVQWGIKSCAHWLAWSCSVSSGVAREYVRVALALTELPLLRAEFAVGRLTWSKVRAVTRVAGRVDERVLVEQALRQTASQLERTVRGFRLADGAVLRQQAARRARWRWDEDGMLVLTARLPADEGAVLLAALEQAEHALLDDSPPAALDAARATDPVDALVSVAHAALAAGPVDTSGDDRHLVVVHADAAVLAETAHPAGDVAQIEDGIGIGRATAQRLACDASLLAVLHSAVPGEELRIGRRTRKISPAQRRALRIRDGGCRFPGCARRRHLQAHHVRHWLHGGRTDLDNLVLLCRTHHMLLHEAGFAVELAPDPAPDLRQHWRFRRPDGQIVLAAPALASGPDLPVIASDAVVPIGRGAGFSLADSVGVLCRAVPA
ncbi:HNH endonuclease signature motif containing protein [Nakamurella leprariae]|uniref:DUF222 domain-containing protein n=1 Tax=Nakamurella leprariae TaxID=2803911 RepID=A0A938YC28_9ACTN|nr:HNH endonuclease signature motif containing protein [Nakamurella leprariae]MBM9466888.1 DUF222 domain-containing protein [Nakamurella leprariae]